jgi:hypothetical protein
MSKPHSTDISIGKDQWIRFIDVVGRESGAASVDHLIAPLESFWSALETNCIAECCGIDAFSLWPDDVRRAASTVDADFLAEGLNALREFVERSEPDIFVSQRLNNYFDRQVLLQAIDHIHAHSTSSQ